MYYTLQGRLGGVDRCWYPGAQSVRRWCGGGGGGILFVVYIYTYIYIYIYYKYTIKYSLYIVYSCIDSKAASVTCVTSVTCASFGCGTCDESKGSFRNPSLSIS